MRTPWAEIDLVLRAPKGVLALVEVKSVKHSDFFVNRISKRQRIRLLRAHSVFAEKEGYCLLMLAIVNECDEVLVFDDVFR